MLDDWLDRTAEPLLMAWFAALDKNEAAPALGYIVFLVLGMYMMGSSRLKACCIDDCLTDYFFCRQLLLSPFIS
jgi:hypothetical protein